MVSLQNPKCKKWKKHIISNSGYGFEANEFSGKLKKESFKITFSIRALVRIIILAINKKLEFSFMFFALIVFTFIFQQEKHFIPFDSIVFEQ